ncbi:MAG: GntR family transcriptional regulator [Firmicutes bacterium]|nr:GntR family transcriptional regulator [Bacillota bacterium]
MRRFLMDVDDETLQHIPKYLRIQQELLHYIRSNEWGPGAKIPSEAELCDQYQVSRGTIRRALDELERQGLINRSPGKPTVVNTPKIPLLSSGFRTDIARKGMKPGTKVLRIHVVKVPPDIAPLLMVSENTQLLLIERVISADDIPIIIESAHVARLVDTITAEEVESTSLLELIPAKCHVNLARAVESYEPIALTKAQAQLLACRAGNLGIKDQAVLYDGENRPVYVSTAIVRGDKARIVTETSFHVHA